MKPIFVPAITIKDYLALKPRPEGLYIKAGCSMENCEGNSNIGFLAVRNIGRAGGEPPGIWNAFAKDAGGLALCVYEDDFLYKKRKI